MKEFIDYLERKIEGCDSLGGMEREKAIYQSVLKDYRKQFAISDVIGSEKINEDNNLLTNEEKIWLKGWINSCNQHWGFEPNDHHTMESIFSKLDIN